MERERALFRDQEGRRHPAIRDREAKLLDVDLDLDLDCSTTEKSFLCMCASNIVNTVMH